MADPHRTMPRAMRFYRTSTRLIEPFAPRILRSRLAKGKEDPDRWREKLGQPSTGRPNGPLVWMHGVGVGEVLALRGLVSLMRASRPDLNVLITSSAASSATAFANNPIEGTIHQFLPLDTPKASAAFLDYWQPNLGIWAEQDLWPGIVWDAAARGIPQAMVNARLNGAALAKRQRAHKLYKAALDCMSLIDAQEEDTAENLRQLGATEVTVSGSLKPVAPPLADWPEERERLAHRGPYWVNAPSHPADEALAIAAQKQLKGQHTLVIAPRLLNRADDILQTCRAEGLTAARWSGGLPEDPVDVVVADNFGQLGLWYRLADAALIGGTFSDIEGHNPWEAIALGSAVIHGPRTANFARDYADLSDGGATLATTPQEIVAALADTAKTRAKAEATRSAEFDRKAALADRLLELIDG
ncbi:3-deoxy-D-manno-octulosonic acid transferase [Marivivens aquimaris]|uniref:3-deoxy-D-manno-octulosonic acid transferase n=1 Tax=Marivivens aquimaris TaxID=2774876 RepID=UPI00188141D5|nr:glycosyltransferase N-terminal domain-containing protein [Marivivens aquimaris]